MKKPFSNCKAPRRTRNGGGSEALRQTLFSSSVLIAWLQGESKQQRLPPGSLQVLLVGVRCCPGFIQFETDRRSLCHSIPLPSLAQRNLQCLTGACNCQTAFPKSINTACCHINTPLLYRLQIFQSSHRPAAASEQTWKKTHEI